MIRVECTCGEVFNADEAHIGKHLRCRRCGRTLEIARVEPGPVPAVGGAPRSPQPTPPAPTPASPHRGPRSPSSTALGYVLGLAVVLVAIVGVRAWLDTSPPPPAQVPAVPPTPIVEVPSTPPEPAPPCDERPRPWSGAVLLHAAEGGEGRLTVTNGTGDDAVVVLADLTTRRGRYAMFVRNSTAATLRGVRVGSYWLQFRLGERLNRRGRFCESAGAQQFDEALDYEIIDYGDQRSVTHVSVTLHPVVGGHARTHAIPDSLVALPGG